MWAICKWYKMAAQDGTFMNLWNVFTAYVFAMRNVGILNLCQYNLPVYLYLFDIILARILEVMRNVLDVYRKSRWIKFKTLGLRVLFGFEISLVLIFFLIYYFNFYVLFWFCWLFFALIFIYTRKNSKNSVVWL